MPVASFNVTIKYKDKDGNDKTLEFIADKVIYDEGGDNSIRVEAYMTVDQMETLDYLEQSQQTVSFSFEAYQCLIAGALGPCDDQTKDYFSDDGEATITWELINNKAIIHLHRVESNE